jgi:hypothetical protein
MSALVPLDVKSHVGSEIGVGMPAWWGELVELEPLDLLGDRLESAFRRLHVWWPRSV